MTPSTTRPFAQADLLLVCLRLGCLSLAIGCGAPAPAGDEARLPEQPGESEPPGPRQQAPSRVEAELTGATQPVHIRFRAQVGAEPFACGSTYTSDTGVTFTPRDLRFFVQDVALLTADGEAEPVTLDVAPPWQLAEVALLDFEDGSGSCSAGNAAVHFDVVGRVRPGNYRGLAFTNGVPEVLNHADPATLPPPLQAGGMSWGWLLGYRFLVAELVASAAAESGPPGSALLHLGSTACSGSPAMGDIHCQNANRNRVHLPSFDPAVDVVVADLAGLFADTDLTQITTCHSSGESCAPLLERIGVQTADGSPRAEQALYRVEAQ